MPKKGSLSWQAESLVCALRSKRKALQCCTHAAASAAITAYLPFSEEKVFSAKSGSKAAEEGESLGSRKIFKDKER